MCFGSKKPKTPPVAPPPTPSTDSVADQGNAQQQVQQAVETEKQAAQKRRYNGAGGTLLTSPLGLETQASTKKKTLLGM